ncbi:hypothetical protein NITLEN_20488 [Nitrospira lenta]|uniref:Uncharacterized protein n=1 Tax=Nitrospira lenta TaxID=1436998 RepID=A0A330L4U3_9BACT|nr:hypothetical protein NITLEN_20488 [Nitrospira lenta]
MQYPARQLAFPNRCDLDQKYPTIFRREFPPHAFLKQYFMSPRQHPLKFERALTIFNRVITGDSEKLIIHKGQRLGVVARNPLLTAGTVFPQMNSKYLPDDGFDGTPLLPFRGTRHILSYTIHDCPSAP